MMFLYMHMIIFSFQSLLLLTTFYFTFLESQTIKILPLACGFFFKPSVLSSMKHDNLKKKIKEFLFRGRKAGRERQRERENMNKHT